MKRYLYPSVLDYIDKKIVLITGPRQVGKTTFAKGLGPSIAYYNYDSKKDVSVFVKNEWDRSQKIVVFDELHKKKNWKLWLKGVYDTEGVANQHIVVTGSARLDLAKKMGDSLAGRFFSYRLYPLDLKELKGTQPTEKNYEGLISRSGFPEPFFEGTSKFYNLWKKTHADLILRQDLISLELVRDVDGIESLMELLSYQVGSTVSYRSLGQALERDEKTIKSWLKHLENLYIVFRLDPYSKGLERGVKKAGKYYFYDIGRVQGEGKSEIEANRLENLVALSLKKEIDFLADTEGIDYDLKFAKMRDQREVDFLILKEKKPIRLIEVKLAQTDIAPSLRTIGAYFKNVEKIQLVRTLGREFSTSDGIKVTPALSYLENLSL